MANTIDELVVTLGLDPSKYSQGRKQVEADNKALRDDSVSTAKEMEARGAQASAFYGQIQRQAVGLFATLVGVGSLDKYLSTTVTSVASLGRVANLLGVAAPDLQAFRLWVQQTGGNADTASGSFLKLTQTMQGFRSGLAIPDASFLLGLSKVGANAQDDALTVFEKYAAWTKGKTGPQQLQEGSLLGLDTDTINAAVKAGPDAAKILAAQKANLPSADDVKNVQDLQAAFFQLRQDVQGEANAMLYGASPALVAFLKLVDRLVTIAPGLSKALIAIATAMTVLGSVRLGAGMLAILTGGGRAAAAAGGAAAIAEGGAIAVGGLPVATVAVGVEALTTQSQAQRDLEARMNASTNPLVNEGAAWNWIKGKFGFGPASAPSAPASKASVAGRVAAAAAVTPPGSRASVVAANLRAAGLSGDDLEAAMRGLNAENPGFDPNRVNPISAGAGDHARGIAQWLRPRAKAFAKWSGHDLAQSTLNEQAQFVAYELHNTGAGKRALADMAAAHSLRDKTFAFLNDFEAPGAAGMLIDMRNAGFGGKRMPNLSGGGSTTTIEVGPVTINTAATDAKGIAKSLKHELASTLANQGNGALN